MGWTWNHQLAKSRSQKNILVSLASLKLMAPWMDGYFTSHYFWYVFPMRKKKNVKFDRNILVTWSHPPIFPPLGALASAQKKLEGTRQGRWRTRKWWAQRRSLGFQQTLGWREREEKIHPRSLTVRPLKSYHFPMGKDRLPITIFQVPC